MTRRVNLDIAKAVAISLRISNRYVNCLYSSIFIAKVNSQHIRGRRHQKFANNDANYVQLDSLLNRVKRLTRSEVEENERQLRQRVTELAMADAMTPEVDIRDAVLEDITQTSGNDGKQYIYLDSDED